MCFDVVDTASLQCGFLLRSAVSVCRGSFFVGVLSAVAAVFVHLDLVAKRLNS